MNRCRCILHAKFHGSSLGHSPELPWSIVTLPGRKHPADRVSHVTLRNEQIILLLPQRLMFGFLMVMPLLVTDASHHPRVMPLAFFFSLDDMLQAILQTTVGLDHDYGHAWRHGAIESESSARKRRGISLASEGDMGICFPAAG